MMTTKHLVIVGASLLSLNSLAEVCTSQMTNSYGQVIREITMTGVDSKDACKEAMKSCRLTLRQMQRNGQMNGGDCTNIGSDTSYPGDDSYPSDDTYPGDNNYPDTTDSYSYEVSQIKRIIQSGGWRARQAAVKDLVHYPSIEALKLSIETVGDMDSDVRAAAESTAHNLSNTVAQLSHPQDLIDGLEVLTKSSNWKIRLLTVKALSKMQSAKAILLFIDMKGDMDSDVRAAATQALNSSVQAHDLKVVARASKSELSQLLKDHNWNTRLAAVKIIGIAKVKSMVNDVVKSTGDNDSDVRAAAKVALKKIIQSNGYTKLGLNKISKLISTYNSSYNWNVRISAVKALGATYNPAVKNTLYKALDDNDSDVRAQAKKEIRKF